MSIFGAERHEPVLIPVSRLGGMRGDTHIARQTTASEARPSEPFFEAVRADEMVLASASLDDLVKMLREAVAAQWQPMIDKTVDLGRGFQKIEMVLGKLADRYGDWRASSAITFIEELADPAGRFNRPVAKNYPPRGLPCVLKVCELYGFDVPKGKVEAVLDSVRLQEKVEDNWKAGRAAFTRWLSING